MGTAPDSPISPDAPVAWQAQEQVYGLPRFGHRTCIFQISDVTPVSLLPRNTVEHAPADCAACGLLLVPTNLVPLPDDSLEDLVARLTTAAAQHVAIHHRYIDDGWGTFGMTGETYRFRANRDWRRAQTALLHLQQQAAVPPPLLSRIDLETVSACAQGMHIRLSQHFAEMPSDPSIASDQARSTQLWEQIQNETMVLYQRLG